MDGVTAMTAHEIVEAITDPLIGAGFIDNSVPNTPPSFARLTAGEAADICGSGGAASTGTVTRGDFRLPRYWSNASGACRPSS